ncbi:MAG: 1-deoxy-D-xylulose-5-phosphate synthase [Bacteroidales bacterium]|nr:1-deoxy-D-xylulose-5-phosphate synthase [Bacteroidales bacterium]
MYIVLQGVILENISNPEELKKLPKSDLGELAMELRHYIVDTLSTHPGHLASSLGTVELAIALHYVFNTPDDKIIWDVGHQAYAHKILTGRRDEFPTIRTYGGLSGFPKMDESPYDAFGTGHSSTSISAALGMAMASKMQGNTSRQHIAVIGDGSMTGGEAFEALNNAAVSKANILVILNDNGISIDKAVGGLSRYLVKITASPRYNRLKERMWRKTGGDERDSKSKNFFSRTLFSLKSALLQSSNLFESLGFRYFGPVDGHNVGYLVDVLSQLKELKGPRLLHIVTKKGKGMKIAEKNPVTYHAPGLFDVETGRQISNKREDQPLKYQEVFGHTIIELAEMNDRIVGITPAMPTGCSLNLMMEQMPDRAFDVGIAEQHAVTFAAGLAAQGMVPFCNIYSSFMQRAYDQVIHDVALQKLHVVFCLDRAGLVGDDGPTHHGAFDMAFFRAVPNLTICAPMDEHELRDMMYTAQMDDMGAVVIRYPRGLSVHSDWKNKMQRIEPGKGRCLRKGANVALLSIGHVGNDAVAAAERLEKEGINVGVYDMRFVKPLDKALLDEVAKTYGYVITIEDGCLEGGFGSAVVEYYNESRAADKEFAVPEVIRLGIPDHFVSHGPVQQLHKDCGFDVESIVQKVKAIYNE